MSNENKVKQAAFRVAFLMPHQKIGPIIETEALLVEANETTEINKDSPEYLAGANDALMYLIKYLKQKGPRI